MKKMMCILSLALTTSALADIGENLPAINILKNKNSVRRSCMLITGNVSEKFNKAIECGNVEVVQKLISRVDVNSPLDGFSPLVKALGLKNDYDSPVPPQNYETIANLLIENGADLNNVSKYGLTPFYVALTSNSANIANLILPNLTAENINQVIIYSGGETSALAYVTDAKITKQLLLQGANPNLVLEYSLGIGEKVQESILLMALRQKNFEKINLLLDAGAELNAVTLNSKTTLDSDKQRIILTSTHALFNTDWTYGQVKEFDTTLGAKDEMLEKIIPHSNKLIARGLDINAQDSYGNTVLHYLASNTGDYAKYASRNYITKKFNYVAGISGVDKSIKNKEGKTALDLAELELAKERKFNGPELKEAEAFFSIVFAKLK